MSLHQRQLSQQTDNTIITPKQTIPEEQKDSIDLEINHSIKPTIFSISISFLLIACSLGLAIWSFVIFTKNKDAYRLQQEQIDYSTASSKKLNLFLSIGDDDGGVNRVFGEEFIMDNNGTQSCNNETRTELLQNMFRREVLVIALSDLFATCLSIGSVIILLIQLVKTSRKMFNEDDDDESFYDKIEKENAAVTRFSIDASSSKHSIIPSTTNGGTTVENNVNGSLQRQSTMIPTSNYKIKERSLWTRLEEDYYLLFIISSGLTLCRIVSGIISLSFTLVLSSELSNECIKGMLTNGLTAFDSVLPFTYTQFGVISLVFLLIPINHLVLYFWLKKNSRVYRYIVGLSRRFERDED